jgi:hypothetical protein
MCLTASSSEATDGKVTEVIFESKKIDVLPSP